jgi:hypothetical protein
MMETIEYSSVVPSGSLIKLERKLGHSICVVKRSSLLEPLFIHPADLDAVFNPSIGEKLLG